MSDRTPSVILSRAADLIRDTAALAIAPPWSACGRSVMDGPDEDHEVALTPTTTTARWIALMSPAVAELLINWLEAEVACIASVDDVQWIMPKILDGIEPGATDEDTTITVTVDTSGPALAFARHVIAVLGEKEEQ